MMWNDDTRGPFNKIYPYYEIPGLLKCQFHKNPDKHKHWHATDHRALKRRQREKL